MATTSRGRARALGIAASHALALALSLALALALALGAARGAAARCHTCHQNGEWCAFGNAIDMTGLPINREWIDTQYQVPLKRNMTIEAWVWAPEPESKNWKTIAARTTGFWQYDTHVPNAYTDFTFQVDDNGLLSFYMGNGCADKWQYGILLLSPDPVPTRQWVHVAAVVNTYEGDTNPHDASIFINGELVDFDCWGDCDRQWLPYQQYNLRIGMYDNTDCDKQWWKGYMDEVRIWDHVRTAEQLQDNMFLRLYPGKPQEGLLLYYTFDDPKHPNNATSILDASTPPYDGEVQFDGPNGPVYYVENRVCTDDHLQPVPREVD